MVKFSSRTKTMHTTNVEDNVACRPLNNVMFFFWGGGIFPESHELDLSNLPSQSTISRRHVCELVLCR